MTSPLGKRESPLGKREISEGYDAIVECIGQPPEFYDRCIALYPDWRGSLLDIGCGRGFFLSRFLQSSYGPRFSTLVGIDISSKLAHETRRRLEDARVHVLQGDAEALPFSDRSFDIVTMTEVLEHLLDWDIALGEAARVLRPGGVFLVTVPNRDWLFYRGYMRHRKAYQPVDDYFFRYREMVSLLTRHFKIRRVEGLQSLFPKGGRLERFEPLALKLFPPFRRKMKGLCFLCEKPA